MKCLMRLGITAVFALAPLAYGTLIVTPIPTLPPEIPGQPNDVVYSGGRGIHALYASVGVTIDLTDVQHRPVTATATRTPSGPNEIESFNSTLSGFASIGGATPIAFQLSGPVQIQAFNKVGNLTGTFTTQIMTMNLTGQVAGHSIAIQQDPTTPSMGQTSITCLTPTCTSTSGLFQIDSFFDVTTDLSLDGGAFMPQISPAVRVTAVTPEPATMFLVGLSLVAVARIRRNRG
jgi:hypothetical protein